MFKKYSSIENSYREEFLEKIKNHGFWKNEFVVQEKVHGANISYWTSDGLEFRAAKRTGNIGESEKFYNYNFLLDELKPKFVNIWKSITSKDSDVKQITFFGEVMGGAYPHKDIKADNKSLKVQKGIYYSPSNHFFAFDIMINANHYLDIDEANKYFEQENLLHAKTLFKGNITDCLSYPNSFESTIPSELGLPELKANTCEGVVIKPSKAVYFNNGVRVILKNKNEKWAENKKHHVSIKKEEKVSEKVAKLQEVILTYATENRLNNVLSKVGEVNYKDMGKVLGMFNKDIVQDFLKDYDAVIAELEKKEVKAITKSLGRTTVGMVRERCVI